MTGRDETITVEQHGVRTPDTAEIGQQRPGPQTFNRRGLLSIGSTLSLATAGSLALEGCGGDSGSSILPTPSPAPTPTPTPTPTPSVTGTSASRFLSQAAIGYAKSDVTAVASTGFDSWITGQFATARPQKFWDFLVANGYNVATNQNSVNGYEPMVWSQLMGSADVLRQRIGIALLDMWVVSIDGFGGSWRPFVLADYLDRLWDNAFGNYRNLMEAVSTSVGMGLFLTFLGSVKANNNGTIPDENYARELMQLFTIGLNQLNPDGTSVLSGGNPVPTYSQAEVSQAARVWTGYTYANAVNSTPNRIQLGLAITAANHETGATSFLGITIPAGSDGATARKLTLDGLFNHANTGPFVSKQLIQRLVTSNPSPAYVARIAAIFANDGKGTRGDMQAVIRAILTDAEARDDSRVSSTTFGKLREPVVRLVQWAKAYGVTSPTNLWPFGNTSSTANRIGESPGHAPSVFNWFRPGYAVQGAIAGAGLVAPEFQITNEPQIIAYVNYMQAVIANGAGEAKPDYASLTTLASDSAALLAEINLVLAANQISAATLASMKTALDTISTATNAGLLSRVYAAIVLVMASPEYLVLR